MTTAQQARRALNVFIGTILFVGAILGVMIGGDAVGAWHIPWWLIAIVLGVFVVSMSVTGYFVGRSQEQSRKHE